MWGNKPVSGAGLFGDVSTDFFQNRTSQIHNRPNRVSQVKCLASFWSIVGVFQRSTTSIAQSTTNAACARCNRSYTTVVATSTKLQATRHMRSAQATASVRFLHICRRRPRRLGPLYILCWRKLSRRRLLPVVSPAVGHLSTPGQHVNNVRLWGVCRNFRPTTSKTSPI